MSSVLKLRWLVIGFMLGIGFSALLRTPAFSAEPPKLFMVLYAGDKIGGTWGPLPYDMAECEARAAERQASIDKMVSTGTGENGVVISAEMKAQIAKWRMACEACDSHPVLGDPL